MQTKLIWVRHAASAPHPSSLTERCCHEEFCVVSSNNCGQDHQPASYDAPLFYIIALITALLKVLQISISVHYKRSKGPKRSACNTQGSCPTWGDLLHQDGGLRGECEAMRVQVWVSLDLNVEAERVVPVITAAGPCWLPISRCSISGKNYSATC